MTTACLELRSGQSAVQGLVLGTPPCKLVCRIEDAPPEREWQSYMVFEGVVGVPKYPEGGEIDYLLAIKVAGAEVQDGAVGELIIPLPGVYTVVGVPFSRASAARDQEVIDTVITVSAVVELTQPGETLEVRLPFQE
jgi:hypothetical protein